MENAEEWLKQAIQVVRFELDRGRIPRDYDQGYVDGDPFGVATFFLHRMEGITGPYNPAWAANCAYSESSRLLHAEFVLPSISILGKRAGRRDERWLEILAQGVLAALLEVALYDVCHQVESIAISGYLNSLGTDRSCVASVLCSKERVLALSTDTLVPVQSLRGLGGRLTGGPGDEVEPFLEFSGSGPSSMDFFNRGRPDGERLPLLGVPPRVWRATLDQLLVGMGGRTRALVTEATGPSCGFLVNGVGSGPMLVHAYRVEQPLGPEAVELLSSELPGSSASTGLLVTTSGLTGSGVDRAVGRGIQCIDGVRLCHLLEALAGVRASLEAGDPGAIVGQGTVALVPEATAPTAPRIRTVPNPGTLVSVLRTGYCAYGVERGTRDPEAPPVLSSRRERADLLMVQRDRIMTAAKRRPVDAANQAEALGQPDLASDCWLFAGDAEGALDVLAPLRLGHGGAHLAQRRVHLALVLEREILPMDFFGLFVSNFTPWAAEHEVDVLITASALLQADSDGSLARTIVEVPDLSWRSGWTLSTGALEGAEALSFPNVYASQTLSLMAKGISREAENQTREAMGLPRVGEGWVSETELFRAIRDALVPVEVIQHGRPAGLGQQHLDVWIPQFRVAVEYQGRQHFEPVEYFGGEEAFRRQRERDARKRDLCRRLGVQLLEVEEGYSLETVLEMIDQARWATE
jgi:hypothetical protein